PVSSVNDWLFASLPGSAAICTRLMRNPDTPMQARHSSSRSEQGLCHCSVTIDDVAFRLPANMRQNPCVVVVDHPTSERQPIKDRLEPQLMGRALVDLRRAVGALHQLEARIDGAKIADHMGSVDVLVWAELVHRRNVAHHGERKLPQRN